MRSLRNSRSSAGRSARPLPGIHAQVTAARRPGSGSPGGGPADPVRRRRDLEHNDDRGGRRKA